MGSTSTNAEMDVDNFLVEVNGSGIREALRLVLDVEFERPDILLVEEPEIHLHPALETSIMRYLKRVSSECQVFITTHSTNFLDTAEGKNQYLVSKPHSTRVELLGKEEAETQIPRELGIRLSSLFLYDRLVFVEGLSDEDVLREWATKLNVNFGQANVGFIAMGGVRNFTHFAAGAVLSFLTKRQVKMWFVVDRDEKQDVEVATLKEQVGVNGSVNVLKKREIENYLLCARAIAEFIQLKKRLSGGADESPSTEDVAKIIEECSDELKHASVDRRVAKLLCKPVYPSMERICSKLKEGTIVDRVTHELETLLGELEAAKSSASQVYAKEAELVDACWHRDRLSIIPGDELLDRVCQKYGVRFKKKQGDSARLAALMKEDEIDREMIDLVRLIGGD